MAPHALLDPHDSTGYTPSMVNYAKILPYVRIHSYSKASATNTAVLTSIGASANAAARESTSQYFWHLSSQDIKDIEASVRCFQSLELPLNAIDRQTFPITESLRSKSENVARAVSGQQKFLIISGLDPQKYTNEEHVILHAGLSSHIGIKRGMPGLEGGDKTVLRKRSNLKSIVRRDLIKHEDHIVAMSCNWNESPGQYHAPPNQTRDIPFHTDHGDIVTLFSLSTSQRGGSFYLADATAVYNDLISIKPKLAKALLDDWIMVSKSPAKPCDIRPIAFVQQDSGRVIMCCNRARITGTPSAPRPDSLPPLSNTQEQALDALHFLAKRQAIEVQLQRGDMIFFNNLSMLHARDAFVDNRAEGNKRHLLRLILKTGDKAHQLPPQLQETWKAMYEHDVGEEILPVKKELFSRATEH